MITNYLIFLVIIALVASIAILIIFIYQEKKYYKENSNNDKVSFKESLDLTDLPIVTFSNNNRKLNFLLDTGANKSIINTKELSTCSYTTLEDKNHLTGLDGIARVVDNVELIISYRNKSFREIFQSTDMSSSFDSIKQATGVSIHGIVGNAFFQKYKYILDFNELVAYSKK